MCLLNAPKWLRKAYASWSESRHLYNIALYKMLIISKELYSDNRKIMHFGCGSAEVSSVLIQFCCKDLHLLN